jgi:omega-6 fatty acid desaturase (delta-12 desaturase)
MVSRENCPGGCSYQEMAQTAMGLPFAKRVLCDWISQNDEQNPKDCIMPVDFDSGKIQGSELNWRHLLAEYRKSNLRKASSQVLNTFIPYFALWILMVIIIRQGYSYWFVLALSFPASLLLVRIFIFFHDCCHNTFFASPRANKILGYISGILAFTPFYDWRRSHGLHHATAQDLDRRGKGDIQTLTVEEYLAAPRMKRFAYRIYRNPFIMLGPGALFYFLVLQRFPKKGGRKRERYSVVITDLVILAVIGVSAMTIGLRAYLLIQISIMAFASSMGVWLFYVQHQFEGVYWARHQDWDVVRVALQGASYYKLPKVLQWLTGNIGLHHAHHFRPVVPNYNLQWFHETVPFLQTVEPLTIRRSLKSLRLNLWDEKGQKLVSFREIKRYGQQNGAF